MAGMRHWRAIFLILGFLSFASACSSPNSGPLSDFQGQNLIDCMKTPSHPSCQGNTRPPNNNDSDDDDTDPDTVSRELLFVPQLTAEKILALEIDPETGALSTGFEHLIPTGAPQGAFQPVDVLVDEENELLFVFTRGTNSFQKRILLYKVNAKDSKLEIQEIFNVAPNPGDSETDFSHAVLHQLETPAGKIQTLYVTEKDRQNASNVDGRLSSFRYFYDSSDSMWKLSRINSQSLPVRRGPGRPSILGARLYVPFFGSSHPRTVMRFDIDPGSGSLSPQAGSNLHWHQSQNIPYSALVSDSARFSRVLALRTDRNRIESYAVNSQNSGSGSDFSDRRVTDFQGNGYERGQMAILHPTEDWVIFPARNGTRQNSGIYSYSLIENGVVGSAFPRMDRQSMGIGFLAISYDGKFLFSANTHQSANTWSVSSYRMSLEDGPTYGSISTVQDEYGTSSQSHSDRIAYGRFLYDN